MYRYWFDHIKGLTPVKKRILYETFREAEILYHAPEDTIRKVTGIEDQDVLAVTESKRSWNLEGAWMRLQERGISLVTLEDDEYPAKLARIVAPPYALYYRGHLPDESHRSVAIVGARGRSAYGSQVARALAKRLAEFTRTVIWERLTVEEEPMLCLDAVWISVIRRAIIFYMKKFLRRVASFRNLFRVHSRFPCFFRRETGLSPDCRTM